MAINDTYFVMPMDMNRVCRVCLQENTNLSPIFCNNQNATNLLDLPQKIQICGGVECHEQDGLPAVICDVCIYKASVAHEFRQLCQHSDARLRLYYDKPSKFTAADSGTQTDERAKALLTKTTEELQNDFFSKQGVIANQQFHSTIPNQEYNPESQNSPVVTAIETLPTVDVNIAVEDAKLFNCHLEFEQEHKVIDKNAEIVPCDNQSVNCTQELIPVPSNMIENVCDMGTSISVAESEVKNEVDYFTYIPKDNETIEQGNSMHNSQMQSDKPEAVQNNFDSQSREDNFFEQSNNNQIIEEQKFKCEICLKFYGTMKSLKKHQLMHNKQYKCEICQKTFCRLDNLEKHKSIHSMKPHACQLCHASFSKLQNLEKHLKTHDDKSDDNTKQSCPDNNVEEVKAYKSEQVFEDQQINTTEQTEFESAPEIFKCDECGQQCSTLKNLKRHTLIHGERKYSCTVCKKWFFRADTLKKHAERHGHGLLDNLDDSNDLYDSDDDPFPRSTDKTSSGNDSKEGAMKKEESGGDDDANGEYKCQHCEKVMTTKKGLRRHVAMHKPKPEPAVCEICKKVCASRARLALHQKTHNKPKEKVPREYLCHICSKVYPSNSSLTYHMRTHTGVKPHVCKICNSGFTTTTSLANHIRIHTGDKPFVCHVCSAAFAVSSAFRRHLTRHTGEANYLCKTCGKAFKRLSTLKEHTYTHSGEKPYVCKTCGAAYSHSGSLFAHQKRCRAQYNDGLVRDDSQHVIGHHINVNNVPSAVRSLAVIGQIF